MREFEKRVEEIKKIGILTKGKKYLINHLKGKRLTQAQAILAHCYDCMGYYSDGRQDCKATQCALYPLMTFNPNKIKAINKK